MCAGRAASTSPEVGPCWLHGLNKNDIADLMDAITSPHFLAHQEK